MRSQRWTLGMAGLALAVGALVWAGCTDSPVGPRVTVGDITLATAADSVLVDESLTLQATVLDSKGQPLQQALAWESSNPAVATVTNGVVKGVDGGTAVISAYAGQVRASAQIRVLERVAAMRFDTTATTLTLRVQERLRLRVHQEDMHGAQLNRALTWTVGDTTIVAVQDGELVGRKAGTTQVTARSEQATAMITVMVQEGVAALEIDSARTRLLTRDTLRLHASAYDRNHELLQRRIQWTSSNTAVATIDSVGLVTALSVGTTTITASSEGISATVVLTVEAIPSGVTIVRPVEALLIDVGDTIQLDVNVSTEAARQAAGGPASAGRQVNGVTVGFRSGDHAIAFVTDDGAVVGVRRGRTYVYAAAGAFVDSIDVTVQLPLRAARVEPSQLTLEVGQEYSLTAVLQDSLGNDLRANGQAWTSADPGVVASVGGGRIRAVGAGTTNVTLTVGGFSATATVTVTSAPTSLTVTPATADLFVGDSLQIAHTINGGDGSQVTWASSTASVTVSATGMVHAVSPGTATVTASAGGLSASAQIRVLEVPETIDVFPPKLRIRVGDKAKLGATPRNGSGGAIPAKVTYTSSDPTVVSVDATGTLTALAEGTVTVTASVGDVSASAEVTVNGNRPPDTGGGGEEETLGNNLSWPVVFAEGVGLSGLAVTADGAPNYLNTGLRPTATENVLVTGLPFFYIANEADCSADGVSLYCQKGINTWQAEWRDGSTEGLRHAAAKWGDNLTHTTATVNAPLRVEVSLDDPAIGLLKGYTMVSVSGTQADEMMATTGATADFVPTIYSTAPRLIVQRIAARDGAVIATVFDQKLGEAADGAGAFSTEVNISGRLVYGYIMDVSRYTLPAEVATSGWWRLTFQLDETGSTNLGARPRNVQIDTVANIVEGEVLTYTPRRSEDGLTTWLDLYLTDATGRAPTREIKLDPPILTMDIGASEQLTATFVDEQGRMVADDRPVTWTVRDPAVASVNAGLVTGLAKGMTWVLGDNEGKVDSSKVIVGMGPIPDPGETGAGSNLSVPVIFTDGRGLTGLPVTVDGARNYGNTGLRPLTAEGITVSSLPFFYDLNVPNEAGLYLQNSGNTWQAEWLDGVANSAYTAAVTWGDNLVNHAWKTNSHVRVEVALTDASQQTLTGYNMQVVSGSGSTEVQATNGTTAPMVPTLYSVAPRLVIQKLAEKGGAVVHTFVDRTLAQDIGSAEETGAFAAEVSGAGKVIYGYNLVPSALPVPEGVTREGWWRISFVLDATAQVGDASVPRNLSLGSVTNVVETESGSEGSGQAPEGTTAGFQPYVSADGTTSWIDIELTASTTGGGENGGGDTGAGNNLSWPVVFAEGLGISGLPVTEDAGIRPFSTENVTVGPLPFFYEGNTTDCELGTVSYYCQGGANTWQAEWLNGMEGAARRAEVKWGDNLTHHAFDTHAPIRVEVALTDLDAGLLRGFNMTSISGTNRDEVFGTDASTGEFAPTLYTESGRLLIEKLNDTDTTLAPIFVALDRGVWQRTDGQGNFAAEVNGSGKVIYGYNFMVQNLDAALFGGAHKYGWWRLTFILGGEGSPTPNAVLQQLAAVSETEEGETLKYTPSLSADGLRTSLTIYIDKGGSGSGSGGHTP